LFYEGKGNRWIPKRRTMSNLKQTWQTDKVGPSSSGRGLTVRRGHDAAPRHSSLAVTQIRPTNGTHCQVPIGTGTTEHELFTALCSAHDDGVMRITRGEAHGAQNSILNVVGMARLGFDRIHNDRFVVALVMLVLWFVPSFMMLLVLVVVIVMSLFLMMFLVMSLIRIHMSLVRASGSWLRVDIGRVKMTEGRLHYGGVIMSNRSITHTGHRVSGAIGIIGGGKPPTGCLTARISTVQ